MAAAAAAAEAEAQGEGQEQGQGQGREHAGRVKRAWGRVVSVPSSRSHCPYAVQTVAAPQPALSLGRSSGRHSHRPRSAAAARSLPDGQTHEHTGTITAARAPLLTDPLTLADA